MASKSKQSKELKQVKSKSEWRQCNHCGVIVYFKDEQNHFEECSVIRLKNSFRGTCISPLTGLSSSSLPENLKHCYVANGVLHAKVSDPDDEGLDWESAPKIRNIILMHPSTMRLCEIPAIGYVTVAGGGYISVHVAWPDHSLDRRSVAFCPFKTSLHFRPPSMVTVQNYSRFVQEADEVTVVCADSEQEEVIQNEDFSAYVNAQFYQEVVAVGMTITCKYWGTRVKVTVTRISPKQVTADDFDEIQSMSEQIGNSSVQSTVYPLDSINESLNDSVCDLTTDSSFDTSKLLSSSSISCSTPISSVKASHSSTLYNKNFRTFSSFQEDPSECDQADYFKVTSLTVITVQKAESDPPVKKITFNDIGGLSQQLHTINRFTEELFSPSNIGRMGAKMYEGMLLYGPSGTGKTFVAEAIGNKYALPFISVTANEVIVSHYGSEDKEVQKRFEEAIARAPSILFLDAIDKLLSSDLDTTNQRKRKVLAVLINMFDKLKGNLKNPVLIIATAQELSAIHYMLRTDDRFSVEIEFKVPSPLERYEILEKLMENNEPHSLTKEELSEISDRTHAYTGSDLAVLCCAAKRLAVIRSMKDGIKDAKELAKTVTINFVDVTNAMKKVTPFSMMIQEVKTEKVSWDDICGLYEVKRRLQQAVEWPLKYPGVFSRYNINPTSGILMHGPPGCSKTMLAKALATESGLNFIAIKGPELFNKWYGESERAIRELFARARDSKPCIIFLDEVDALLIGRESSSDGSEVGRKVVCQFLSEFGGIGACDGIIVIAATNRPDILDDAVLRPGRIGELVEIPLPDAETRKEILQKKFKEMPVSDDIDFELLVEKTKGFSGAQVVASCKEAAWLLVDETFTESSKITMSMLEETFKSRKITMPMLLEAIENIRKPQGTNLDDYD